MHDTPGPRSRSAALRTAGALAVAGALASCAAPYATTRDYEIWALDQGTGIVHIYGSSLVETARIDLAAKGVKTPHMVDFTSDHAYAFIASTGSGDVSVIRAKDRAVVAVIKTGPGTHMAGVLPGDRAVLADVIGDPKVARDGKLVELLFDRASESVKIGRTLVVADDPLVKAAAERFKDTNPICHAATPDGKLAFVTLGPGLKDGGLVVLDTERFVLARAFPPDELAVNCGTLLAPGGKHILLNGGDRGVGRWYVMDAADFRIVAQGESRGEDAHGVAATSGGKEIWMVNRVTSNGVVLDPATWRVAAELKEIGPTPDILAVSPDGSRVFATTRGPNPVSAPHVAKGTTPGFAVVDVATRKLVKLVQPAAGNEKSDFHGIAVRPLD